MSEPEKAPPQRTLSQESLRVQTAQRNEPVRGAPQGAVSSRLKEGAADTALNVAGILRDFWDDFRNSDRFFKFKAGILAGWLLLSAAGIFVACPGGGGPTNDIGARLVTTRVLDTPVFMIVNDSGRDWEDVVVEVNHGFRAAVGRVPHQAPDNNLTLEPRKLLGEGGRLAPPNLEVEHLSVRTRRGQAVLLVGGRKVE